MEPAVGQASHRGLRPTHVLFAALGYLGVVFIAILVVDVAGLTGLGAWLAAHAPQPFLWFVVFNEKGPTELLQWTLLAATAVLAAQLSGRLAAVGERGPARFWVLVAVTAVVLALEDAATVRHVLSSFTMAIVGAEGRHPVRIATELVYYAAIASIPVYALLAHWQYVMLGPMRPWLLGGYAAYGLAGFASASRDIGGWYVRFGSWLDERSGGRLGDGFVPEVADRPVGFFLVDFILEESLELMAAALLLGAVLACRGALRVHEGSAEGPLDG